MAEGLPPGHPDGEPLVLKLGPGWNDPDGVDIPAAIALWSPALGCLLQKLGQTTAHFWPIPFFLTDPEKSPDFGDIPDFLRLAIEAWWDWYERDDEQCRCPELQCLNPTAHRCRLTRKIEREDRIEFLAYDVFDAMIEGGKGYTLKYLPADDAGADWQPFSPARLRILNRCDKDLRQSTVKLDGSTIRVRVFRADSHVAKSAAKEAMKVTGRGGRPPKYDWEAFHIEITRIALADGELPDRAELHRRMSAWCGNRWAEQPEESELRKRMSRLYGTPGIVP
jgi:hypothetical protein